MLFATEKFRKDNPKTYKAFQLALQEAAQFATANPEKAADTYLRVTGAKLDRDFLIKIIKNPDVQFKLAPQNTPLAQFMHKVGAIKTAPPAGASISSTTPSSPRAAKGKARPRRGLEVGAVEPRRTDMSIHSASPVDNAENQGPLLRVDKVSLEYKTPERRVRATHQVSFDVHASERFILLGPSGCGKSTLLKAVAGFIKPTEGRIALDDRPVQGPPGPRRGVPGIRPAAAVEDAAAERGVSADRLAQAGPARADQRAMHYLDKVGLAGFADAYPHTLSGGMKQRVAIARAGHAAARAADGRALRRAGR